MSTVYEERLIDIIEETANFDLVLLCGTSVKAPRDGSVKHMVHKNITCLAAGWERATLTNAACGCSVTVGKRCSRSKIHDLQLPPKKLRGRGLAIKIFSRMADFTAICCYFPPTPRKKEDLAKYLTTCRELSSWVASVLQKLPAKTTAILYSYVNDGVGLQNRSGN